MKNRIRELRHEKNILQSELAHEIGVSQRLIAFYESGQRDPNTDTLAKLANFFNCSIDYLLCRTSQRNFSIGEKEFYSLYEKDLEGLTESEIREALQFYKKIKYGN